jgi:hypothetical protein
LLDGHSVTGATPPAQETPLLSDHNKGEETKLTVVASKNRIAEMLKCIFQSTVTKV